MDVLIVVGAATLALVAAYFLYGSWLARHVFQLDSQASCPATELNDGRDYVPTSPFVVFGHHFTSIAGTGPIVGPAIAVMWGWLPALLWVVCGSILIGAVHDFGSLVVSLRNKGRTVGDLAGRLAGPRLRILFLLVLFVALTIVLAVFGLVIANVFRLFPSAIAPCLLQIPIAVGIGVWLHRRGAGLLAPSLAALAAMYAAVFLGDAGWLHAFNASLATMPVWAWTALLLLYCYVASVLPVWVLLQPRDFINALQLVAALALLACGLVAAAVAGGGAGEAQLEFVAPMVQWAPADAPAIWPFLFITVACGAVSGFHCLVSSGMSSKQLRCETHAKPVGYGAMMLESFLAVLVIAACAAGLGLGFAGADGVVRSGSAAWTAQYASWTEAGGLARTIGAFVGGASNFLQAIGMPPGAAVALMGVFVASFAATTLDSCCRLQRYVLQELSAALKESQPATMRGAAWNPATWIGGTHGATLLAVVVAACVAAVPPPGEPWGIETAGKGGMLLWPIFGATNQLLAGLAFLVILFYLRRTNRPLWFAVLPAVFMLVMPMWAMILQVFVGSGAVPGWIPSGNWLLASFGIVSILLEIWIVAEALRLFPAAGIAADRPLEAGNTTA